MVGDRLNSFRLPSADRDFAVSGLNYPDNDVSVSMARLRRYVSPQIAEMILKSPNEANVWEIHRREITVVFLRLEGFIWFADCAEPEEVMTVVRGYHEAMGKMILYFDGTIERFTAAGIKAFFNDPVLCQDHALKAVRMALELRERARELRVGWQKKGYELDLCIGLAAGYATVGNFGFRERMDYASVGKIANLAQRLCQVASGGQILTNQKTLSKIETTVDAQPVSTHHFDGFRCPSEVFNIVRCS